MKALTELGFEFRNCGHAVFTVQSPLPDTEQNKTHKFLLSQLWQISQAFKNPKEESASFVRQVAEVIINLGLNNFVRIQICSWISLF